MIEAAAETDGGGLPNVINQAVAAAPDKWRLRLTRTLLKIVGSVASPEAALRVSEHIDTMSGRSIVAKELAKAVAERLSKDPAQVERAIERFYGDAAANQENLESIARMTAEELDPATAESDPPQDEVSEDWRRRFTSYAGDVSEPEMQRVWAKILAGEVVQPGSYSLRTLRLVSELDRSVADHFATAAMNQFQGSLIYTPLAEYGQGTKFHRMTLLQDAGLASGPPGAINKLMTKDGSGRYFLHGYANYGMMYWPNGPAQLSVAVVQLTAPGKELLRLLPPNNEAQVIKTILCELRPLPRDPVELAVVGRMVRLDGDQVTMAEPEFLWGGPQQLANIPAG